MQGLERVAPGIVQSSDKTAYLAHMAKRQSNIADKEKLESLFLRVEALEQEVKKLRNKK